MILPTVDEEVENLIAENGNALEGKTEAQIVLVTVNYRWYFYR